jgi:hypothetical protein
MNIREATKATAASLRGRWNRRAMKVGIDESSTGDGF